MIRNNGRRFAPLIRQDSSFKKPTSFTAQASFPTRSGMSTTLPLLTPLPLVSRYSCAATQTNHHENARVHRSYAYLVAAGISAGTGVAFLLNRQPTVSAEEVKKEVTEEVVEESITNSDKEKAELLDKLKDILSSKINSNALSKNQNPLDTLREKLKKAFRKGNMSSLKAILKDKANLGMLQSKDAKIMLHMLAAQLNRDHLNLLYWLLENKYINLNYQDKDGDTILIYAIAYNNIPLIKKLITSGVDKELKNKKGATALLYAALNGKLEMVQLLIEAGADTNAVNNHLNNLFCLAIHSGSKALIEYLIKKKLASFNNKDNKGKNALELFCAYQHQINKIKQKGREVGGSASMHMLNYLNQSNLNNLSTVEKCELLDYLIENVKDQEINDDALFIYKRFIKSCILNNDFDLASKIVLFLKEKNKINMDQFFEELKADKKLKEKAESLNKVCQHELAFELAKTLIRKKDYYEGVIQAQKNRRYKDKKSTIEAFSRILSEKVVAILYADKAIHEQLVNPLTASPTTLFDVISVGTAMAPDTRMRVIAQLLNVIAKNKTGKAFENYQRNKAAYIEQFQNHSILREVQTASTMVAKRYERQLSRLSGEAMEHFADFLQDKLMDYLHNINKRSWIDYLHPTTKQIKKISTQFVSPISTKLYKAMVKNTGEETVALELRSEKKQRFNNNELMCWNARELITNTGVLLRRDPHYMDLVADGKGKVNQNQLLPLHVQKKRNLIEHQESKLYYVLADEKRDGIQKKKYGYCYGNATDVVRLNLTLPVNESSLEPYKPFKHLNFFISELNKQENNQENKQVKQYDMEVNAKEHIITIKIDKKAVDHHVSFNRNESQYWTPLPQTRIQWLLGWALDKEEGGKYKDHFVMTNENDDNNFVIVIKLKKSHPNEQEEALFDALKTKLESIFLRDTKVASHFSKDQSAVKTKQSSEDRSAVKDEQLRTHLSSASSNISTFHP